MHIKNITRIAHTHTLYYKIIIINHRRYTDPSRTRVFHVWKIPIREALYQCFTKWAISSSCWGRGVLELSVVGMQVASSITEHCVTKVSMRIFWKLWRFQMFVVPHGLDNFVGYQRVDCLRKKLFTEISFYVATQSIFTVVRTDHLKKLTREGAVWDFRTPKGALSEKKGLRNTALDQYLLQYRCIPCRPVRRRRPPAVPVHETPTCGLIEHFLKANYK